MFNIQKMIKQAQEMQKKVEDVRNSLGDIDVVAQAGGGVVEVKCNAKNEFLSIKIKPEAINPDDPASVDIDTIETLEDLITSAIKDANKKAEEISEAKMKEITGGMNLNIPGLF